MRQHKEYIVGGKECGIHIKKHKIRIAKQCKSKSPLAINRCQAARGHDGLCWCYDGRGFLEEWRRGNPASYERIIAPDSKDYIHPIDKLKEHFSNNIECIPVGGGLDTGS